VSAPGTAREQGLQAARLQCNPHTVHDALSDPAPPPHATLCMQVQTVALTRGVWVSQRQVRIIGTGSETKPLLLQPRSAAGMLRLMRDKCVRRQALVCCRVPRESLSVTAR
jgi:hypothetical protein